MTPQFCKNRTLTSQFQISWIVLVDFGQNFKVALFASNWLRVLWNELWWYLQRFLSKKTPRKVALLEGSKRVHNQPKSMDYTAWIWSILVQFLKSHCLLQIDSECFEINFGDVYSAFWAKNSGKNGIIGKVKKGPKSAKKHGLYPMVLVDFGPILKVPLSS